MPLVILVLFFIFCGHLYASQPDPHCVDWFNTGKINATAESCVIKCASLIVDMDTFMCPDQCDFLCKKNDPSPLRSFLYYPGLTPAEKKLTEKYPTETLTVFIQKIRAELTSDRNFPDQDLNDEGDAFRHFIWAGLLTKELGANRAKEFLDAHEANPLQSESERNMDQFNNDKGILSAQKLISNKNWNLENLEKYGLESLRSKNLKVINPRLKIPEVPK